MFVMKSPVAVLRPDIIQPQPTRYMARDDGAPGPALWAADRLNAQLSHEDTPFGRTNQALTPGAGLPASQTVARLSWPASSDAVSSRSSVSELFAVAIGPSARSPPAPEERGTERRDLPVLPASARLRRTQVIGVEEEACSTANTGG
jgi:hypothetical protein